MLAVKIAAAALALALAPVAHAQSSDPAPAATPEKTAPEGQIDLVEIGEADAPVTVYAYLSPICPHCAAFYQDGLQRVEEELIDSGQMRLVIRGLPSQPVAMSLAGMMIIDCAPDSRAASDKIFTEQADWIEQAQAGDAKAFLLEAGEQAGLSAEEAEACLIDENLAQSLYDGAGEAAEAYGMEGVPSFIIDGELVDYSQLSTLEGWREAIGAEAAGDSESE